MPYASETRAALFVGPLTLAMQQFGITTGRRQAAFLANVAVESGSLAYVKELGNPNYEGRKDLGNTESGDGLRFLGRGLPMITGRANYLACGKALGLDLIAHPELLEQPIPAAASAGWFWQTKGFSGLADSRKFGTICHLWNGGYNGLDPRIEHYVVGCKVLDP